MTLVTRLRLRQALNVVSARWRPPCRSERLRQVL